MVNITFSPTTTGSQLGTITIPDDTRINPLAISVQGAGVSGSFLTIYPARQTFAPQTVGTNGNPSAIRLLNTGNATLNITGISIIGTNSSDFSETNNCGSSLPAGASCTVNVTFTPTAVGSRTSSLSVGDTAPGGPQSTTLNGTGLGPIPSLSANSLAFASQVVGTTSAAQIVSLKNIGNVALNIINIAASGDFGETNACVTSLVAGGNCQISVTFSPAAAGNRTGAIIISDNAVGGSQTIALSGVATVPPDFTIASETGSPTSQTIIAGQTATFSLALMPTGSFSGTVSLNCTITPVVTPAPTCSLSSSSVQISGGGAQIVTATVGTTVPVVMGTVFLGDIPPGTVPLAWTLMLLGSGWLLVRNRKPLPVCAAPVMLLALASWISCGGGGSSTPRTTPGTPPGTYTVTITGSSGSLSHNTTVQVIVQ